MRLPELKYSPVIYTLQKAQRNLSRLIEEACNGHEVIITRGRHPAVRLVPIVTFRRVRVSGRLQAKIRYSRDAFEPMSDSESARWGDQVTLLRDA